MPAVVGAAHPSQSLRTITFSQDLAFLTAHTEIILLKGDDGAQVAVAPAWQGRVMTSTARGPGDQSFGWVNRSLIGSRVFQDHFNPLGGEDRFWLGPEGGQYSLYFRQGAPFDLSHWYVPKPLDTLPFRVVEHGADHVSLESTFDLTNYSGTHFAARVERTVHVLSSGAAWKHLSGQRVPDVSLVAFESVNRLINIGDVAWRKESGLPSVWILGMFNPSPGSTIVIPIRPGPEAEFGRTVTADYFGSIPPDRLRVSDNAVFLRADGEYRSKVGINPRRSLGRLGSYDRANQVLTVVEFDQPKGVVDYVNSLWKIQPDPYGGDAANAYNDGSPAPGVPAMGPFYELESSSPAAALAPGAHLTHSHRTFHLVGPREALDVVARAALGVSLADIEGAFRRN